MPPVAGCSRWVGLGCFLLFGQVFVSLWNIPRFVRKNDLFLQTFGSYVHYIGRSVLFHNLYVCFFFVWYYCLQTCCCKRITICSTKVNNKSYNIMKDWTPQFVFICCCAKKKSTQRIDLEIIWSTLDVSCPAEESL